MTHPLYNSRRNAMRGMASDIVPVVPNDSTELTGTVLGLYIETGGAISFEVENGATRTVNVPDNFEMVCVGIRKVLLTGTTADGIHAYTG